ncbi:signal transduction histidine kinase [Pseudoduganella lurida]|uniref:histidine kinase n=1 Tax=Pseudoduganella lurida TaxID=1036180 RepID=A0A562R8J6_9BURK|nr:ATP-binding protein [Pseudoduganella lurida]TWI65372.1 signal transduction histidine kinase [Pseudoduganella lurida]
MQTRSGQPPVHVHPRLPTIRFRLVLLVLSCVLPAAIVSAFLIYDHYRVERASLLGEAMATARSMVAVVDRDFDTVTTALRTLSVSDALDLPDRSNFRRQAANVHAILPITEVVLYDPITHQQLMNTTVGTPLPDPGNAELLREVLRTGQPVVTGTVRNARGNGSITVAVPVLRDGVVRYVLAAEVLPAALSTILTDQKIPEHWRAAILDADYRIVARNVDIARYRGRLPEADVIARMRARPEDTFDGTTVDDRHVVMLYSRSAKSGWSVTLGVPHRTLAAGLLRTLESLIIATVVILALGLGMAWLVGGRIARSVQALIGPATELGAGRQVHPPVVDFLEAQQVGDSLVRAAAALDDAREQAASELLERRAAQEALQLADVRKDEFLATLAHELRNPMAPLVNALEIMRLAGPGAAPPPAVLDIIGRQLKQMVRLVDDLLDVSRITTDKLGIRTEAVVLQDVVSHSLETAGPLIGQRRHALAVHVPDSPVLLRADATRLAQVFSNLLNNAAKYTPNGGSIALHAVCLPEGGRVRIDISDNGIGIASDVLPHVFDIFYQADRSLGRSQAGLGIGLSLARRLVELHGGTLSAASPGKGLGSTFSVELPVAADATAPVPERDNAGGALPPLRVLVADDNIDHANTLRTLLMAAGQTVNVCYDGLSALRSAEAFDPQIAFLDIGMPRMDGYELARRLRSEPRHRDCLLVAVTGWGQDRDQQRSQAAGFDRHVVKPLQPAQLRALLQERASRATMADTAQVR